MFASNAPFYLPGDVIYVSKPFMRAIRKEFWGIICPKCLKRTSDLKFCSGCRIMKYCGKICQKADWCYHKFECSLLKDFSDDHHHSSTFLIGNIIMKMQKTNWDSSPQRIQNETVSFDSLRTLKREYLANFAASIEVENIKNSLNAYIGEENIPDDERLLTLISKVLCNKVVYGQDNALSAIYIGLARFGTSCIPNCEVNLGSHSLTVISIKKIRKNGEEFTITMSPLTTSLNLNLECAEAKNMDNSRDPCSYCQMPFVTSPLRKLLDREKADPVIMESENTFHLAKYLLKLNYPLGVISQQKLRQLLQKQKGVLGDTNILRIRTLALKSYLLNGPLLEMRDDLMELVDVVKAVWGQNFKELIPIYAKLMDVNLRLRQPYVASVYENECYRLRKFFIGIDETELLGVFNEMFAVKFRNLFSNLERDKL